MLLLTSCAAAFCRTVEEAGYRAGIYFNQAYGYQQFNLLSLKDHIFWLAQYEEVPTFVYNFQMWQYSNSGTVPGISGAGGPQYLLLEQILIGMFHKSLCFGGGIFCCSDS